MAAWDKLTAEGVKARVVSMPSTDASTSRMPLIANPYCRKRFCPRRGRSRYRGLLVQYVGLNGAIVGMTTFGESAPAEQLFEEFGFTVDNVVAKAKALL